MRNQEAINPSPLPLLLSTHPSQNQIDKNINESVPIEKLETGAEYMVAALRIQDTYRIYNRKKIMKAVACIQRQFRTWKMRRNFLSMRHHAIQIQAAFRGHHVRRHYRRIIRSFSMLEDLILRWRVKKLLSTLHAIIEVVSTRMNSDPSSNGDKVFGE